MRRAGVEPRGGDNRDTVYVRRGRFASDETRWSVVGVNHAAVGRALERGVYVVGVDRSRFDAALCSGTAVSCVVRVPPSKDVAHPSRTIPPTGVARGAFGAFGAFGC